MNGLIYPAGEWEAWAYCKEKVVGHWSERVLVIGVNGRARRFLFSDGVLKRIVYNRGANKMANIQQRNLQVFISTLLSGANSLCWKINRSANSKITIIRSAYQSAKGLFGRCRGCRSRWVEGLARLAPDVQLGVKTRITNTWFQEDFQAQQKWRMIGNYPSEVEEVI